MERDCGAWINLLSHKVKKRLNATLADLGITGVQSRIMHYIVVHCENGPVFQRDVEEAFGLSRSTATGILQLLEKNGVSVSNVPSERTPEYYKKRHCAQYVAFCAELVAEELEKN